MKIFYSENQKNKEKNRIEKSPLIIETEILTFHITIMLYHGISGGNSCKQGDNPFQGSLREMVERKKGVHNPLLRAVRYCGSIDDFHRNSWI